jgi:CSLREA domain-containing protein
MNSHRRLVLLLGIACLLLGLLSHAARTEVKRADKERTAQIKERSERRSLAEKSSDNNARFNQLSSRLESPAVTETALSRTAAIPPQASTSFTVNSTADPGTGVCDDAECTLREAITAANTHAGTDTIVFNVAARARALRRVAENSTLNNQEFNRVLC